MLGIKLVIFMSFPRTLYILIHLNSSISCDYIFHKMLLKLLHYKKLSIEHNKK